MILSADISAKTWAQVNTGLSLPGEKQTEPVFFDYREEYITLTPSQNMWCPFAANLKPFITQFSFFTLENGTEGLTHANQVFYH